MYDILDFDALENHLKPFGKTQLVGKSFGILKLITSNDEYDFALPRTEKKVAKGHKGFDVQTNPSLSFKQAAIRRDFTINALGYDYLNKKILDPFDGLKDLKEKKLKHICDETFVEDPLRVYRAVQFAARFEFILSDETLKLCQKMFHENMLHELAKERVFEEFKKFLLQAKRPSLALKLLDTIGILNYFEELKSLKNCIQDEEYHPEGDVWIHTCMVVDEMAKRKTNDSKKDLILMLACLCHDLGKPFCTKEINGHITSYKHESLGVEPTKTFLSKLCDEKKLIEEVCSLVKYHLAPFQFYLHNSSLKAVKRLSLKVNIENLCLVALSDCLGRDIKDKDKCHKAVVWLLNLSEELNISNEPLKPLVQGRDLMQLGYKPSPLFKKILDFAMELQIEENLDKEEILHKISEHYQV